MSRYDKLFAKAEGAFVPFIMLSDPTPEDAVEIVSAVVDAGAEPLHILVTLSGRGDKDIAHVRASLADREEK